jgi:hypothetical protein
MHRYVRFTLVRVIELGYWAACVHGHAVHEYAVIYAVLIHYAVLCMVGMHWGWPCRAGGGLACRSGVVGAGALPGWRP